MVCACSISRASTAPSVATSRLRRRVRRALWLPLEEADRRHEEQRAGDRPGEVEDAVVARWRVAKEHSFEHPLDDGRRAGVADEVRAELAAPDRAERHVGTHDLEL